MKSFLPRKDRVLGENKSNSIFAKEEAFHLRSSTVTLSYVFPTFRVLYLFVRLSLCRKQRTPNIRTLFCLVVIKKRSFFISYVFWLVFLNPSSPLCFRLISCIRCNGMCEFQIMPHFSEGLTVAQVSVMMYGIHCRVIFSLIGASTVSRRKKERKKERPHVCPMAEDNEMCVKWKNQSCRNPKQKYFSIHVYQLHNSLCRCNGICELVSVSLYDIHCRVVSSLIGASTVSWRKEERPDLCHMAEDNQMCINWKN